MEQMQVGSVQTQQTFLDKLARMIAQMQVFMEGKTRFRDRVRASLLDFTHVPNTPISYNSPGGTGRSNCRFKKLDMPLFDGSNPDSWIMRAEQYHDFYRLTDVEKVEVVVVVMEGDALFWYQWEHRRRPITQWAKLKTLLRRQFQATQEGYLYGQWLSVAQTSTMAEYRKKFIEYAAPLDGVTEEVTLGQFITGLKSDIKAELKLHVPPNLETAMELAFKMEKKLNQTQPKNFFTKSPHHPSPTTNKYPAQYSNLAPARTTYLSPNFTSTKSPTYNPAIPRTNNGGIRRLSDTEYQHRRERELCYRRDEKWSVSHHCK